MIDIFIKRFQMPFSMNSEKHKRLLREQRERKLERKHTPPTEPKMEKAQQRGYNRIYHDHYKSLLFITFGLVFLSLLVIGYTYVKTGDVIYKGVSLSGGITINVGTRGLSTIDVNMLEERLVQEFPANDISVREISNFGKQEGLTIEVATKDNNRESLDTLEQSILAALAKDIPDITSRASAEVTGPSLGASFFQQTVKAVLIAFVFMGLVVFIYFGETLTQKIITFVVSLIEAFLIWNANEIVLSTLAVVIGIVLLVMYIRYSIPSTAVVLAAFSTIVLTIAVVDILQMRISTAGIAAFLMLLGYSVDTDILLSTRVLKSTTGTVYERIVSTIKTGLTMTGATFASVVVSLIFTQSDVIREILTIIMIGLVGDVLFTWVQNSGILRLYLERKGRKSDDA
jgi:preprotein translocase subunit SecF